jgi:hypothetical protein
MLSPVKGSLCLYFHLSRTFCVNVFIFQGQFVCMFSSFKTLTQNVLERWKQKHKLSLKDESINTNCPWKMKTLTQNVLERWNHKHKLSLKQSYNRYLTICIYAFTSHWQFVFMLSSVNDILCLCFDQQKLSLPDESINTNRHLLVKHNHKLSLTDQNINTKCPWLIKAYTQTVLDWSKHKHKMSLTDESINTNWSTSFHLLIGGIKNNRHPICFFMNRPRNLLYVLSEQYIR